MSEDEAPSTPQEEAVEEIAEAVSEVDRQLLEAAEKISNTVDSMYRFLPEEDRKEVIELALFLYSLHGFGSFLQKVTNSKQPVTIKITSPIHEERLIVTSSIDRPINCLCFMAKVIFAEFPRIINQKHEFRDGVWEASCDRAIFRYKPGDMKSGNNKPARDAEIVVAMVNVAQARRLIGRATLWATIKTVRGSQKRSAKRSPSSFVGRNLQRGGTTLREKALAYLEGKRT